MIRLKKNKKKIQIFFDYKYDLSFIEACKSKYLKWVLDEKSWMLQFSSATMPINVEDLIVEYKVLFDFYSNETINSFKNAYNGLVKSINKITKKSKTFDNLDIDALYPNLREHQKIGIKFLLTQESAILADEMGLGKTRTTCVSALLTTNNKILIVTPLSARFVWKKELVIDLKVDPTRIQIVEDSIDNKKDIIIINYDKLLKFKEILTKLKFKYLIFDEAHFIKNKDSKRTKISLQIAKKTEKVICVTGTPVMNRPVELFTLLKAIKHPLGDSYTDFTARYCGRTLTKFGWDVSGSSNINELAEKLKGSMLRRLTEDCIDLPEKNYTFYKIPMPKTMEKEYNEILNGYIHFCKENKDQYENNIIQNHLARLNKLRQICSKYKTKEVKKWIDDTIQDNRKILVFGFYKAPLQELHEEYKDCSVLFTGDTPEPLKEEYVKELQENPKTKVFIGNIIAAGESITLTKANTVIFNDLVWTPAKHQQAEKRANRWGATQNTNIIYPIFENTVEDMIYKILEEKGYIIDSIMQPAVEHYKKESVIKDVIKKFYKMV